MALGLLWMGVSLFWALQAHVSLQLIVNPSLDIIPLQPDFKHDQFQGRWYAIGVAESDIQNATESQLEMFSTTFELIGNDSYSVTGLMPTEHGCDLWIRTFSPSVYPGEFTLSNMEAYNYIQNYTVRVVSTDYKNFGVMFMKMTKTVGVHVEITLYGRTKALSSQVKEDFVKFSKTVGFTNDNIIFTDPIGNDHLGRGEGDIGSVQVCCPNKQKRQDLVPSCHY
uniref:Neutrophil gelatinase-associated lipocalin-like n=1 Tax=Cavia porcellus TaxID=10141 RepID=A0A286XSW2_CAVPO|nr:neutrophil gelatinase-associated lipocalin-like [Cavia porcellus]